VQRVLDSMSGTPAFVFNERLDILATNALGVALYSPIYADPVKPPNNAMFTFLDPQGPSSSATGTRLPTTSSSSFAPRQDAIPTTGNSRT
jgi:hypothetical protein